MAKEQPATQPPLTPKDHAALKLALQQFDDMDPAFCLQAAACLVRIASALLSIGRADDQGGELMAQLHDNLVHV